MKWSDIEVKRSKVKCQRSDQI